MDIDKQISRIKGTDTRKLCQQRLNSALRLKSEQDAGAAALRDAIDSELVHRFGAPSDGWSSGAQGEPRYFMQNSKIAGVVFRIDTHGIDKGEYALEVRGQLQSEYPRNVDAARERVERLFREH